MRIWSSYNDVKTTVDQLYYYQNSFGKVPPLLVNAVKDILKYATKGQIREFYSYLAYKSPELVSLFIDCQPD